MGTRLLLADDSITIQKVVGIIFANEDYDLTVVDNGVAALEKAREIRPHVMLVDALMPGKSGYEVCEEVRRDPDLRTVPLLLLVGAFEPFDEERARNSGADDHITKPFESQSLIDKVKELAELGLSRFSEAPPAEEQLPPEAPEPVAAEPAISPAASESANLVDSFRGFVHLGGDAAQSPLSQPPVTETAPAPPMDEAPTESVILLSSIDIVEAVPEDDPWGTFAEEVTEGEPLQCGDVLDGEEPPGLSDTVDEIEPFALLDEDISPVGPDASAYLEETVIEEEAAVSAPEEEAFGAALHEPPDYAGFMPKEPNAPMSLSGSISLGEEPEAGESATEWESVAETEKIDADFDSFAPVAEETGMPFAPEEEYLPAEESPVVTQETPDAPVPDAGSVVPLVAEKVATLTEEQLAAAVSGISRELIEKIVWEVVPDLAETIIREEIRKIKEGMMR